ncbi:ATP-dependent helicase [Microbulbifer sp. OS29]|uniref:DNA 3'-5' helicase n=1 Tax=Microbulbifer okhotskensis TaxID=2926617 RepID=A0A9X2ENA7_9GAMM|nr:ATP-dependent DNA helicase [Microbulbifer okhotskensis]MCO1334871.1 ATP-dependent helicase [Microbulbifer okhotskensis]
MNLTPSQKKATEVIDKNLQIIACAGSGKTQVVSERIIKILKRGDVEPKNIVAFTYTEKAAAELKHRVLKIAKEELGSIQGMAELYIGTIHAWCMHYLQEHIFGYQKYSVLNDVRLKLFIDQRNRKIGMSDLKVLVKGKEPRELRRFSETGVFLDTLSVARECELQHGQQLPKDIQDVIGKYEGELDRHAYFDFTMILTRFLSELKNNTETRKLITSDVKYLIVDEYQDVNYIQEQIIEELYELGVKLCVVGDDDQTIYQWRGSSLENILNFSKKYQDVEQVTLDDNFRSSNGVIEVAHAVIKHISNNHRLSKTMNASGHQSYEEGDLQLESFETTEAENSYIIQQIKNLRGKSFKDKADSACRGLDYSDMSILLRKWKPATELAEALKTAGIPYVVTGVAQLFEQDEVEACVNIYRFIARDISAAELKASWLKVSASLDPKLLEKAINFLEGIIPDNNEWHELFNLQEIFINFREKAGITEDRITGKDNSQLSHAEVVFFNMGMFSQVIEDFEVIHFRDDQEDKLSNFLKFLAFSAKDYYPEGWLNKSLISPNAVTITTIHQAKGLEWPVVFLPRMNRNYFPSRSRGGLSAWHIINPQLIKNYEGLKGTEEDELRLLYVALTRSKKYLFVSRAPGSGKLDKKPSDFLNYLKESHYIFKDPGYKFDDRKISPLRDSRELSDIVLNFTLLEAFYNCPYSFKYYTLYGFKEPLSPRMGYGKSIHDTLMEIHRKAMEGNPPTKDELDSILSNHVHFPYAIPQVKDQMRVKASKAVDDYFSKYSEEFDKIEYAEKNIELDLGDGIIINGRMDLIKKRDLDGVDKTYIVDFKSEYKEDRHALGVKQLLLYALGYKELTGNTADFLQIYDFATSNENNIRLSNTDLDDAAAEIVNAADKIRNNDLHESCKKKTCPCRFQKQH